MKKRNAPVNFWKFTLQKVKACQSLSIYLQIQTKKEQKKFLEVLGQKVINALLNKKEQYIKFLFSSMATRYTIVYYFVINCILNLPFIIGGFYFARSESTLCMNLHLHRHEINLDMLKWIKLFSYNQMAYLMSLLLVAVLRLCTGETKDCLLAFSVCLIIFNSFFQVGWLITGSILFWEQQNTRTSNVCSNQLKIFMYCLLIISYFLIALNLVLTRKYCLESQYKDEEDIQPEELVKNNDINFQTTIP